MAEVAKCFYQILIEVRFSLGDLLNECKDCGMYPLSTLFRVETKPFSHLLRREMKPGTVYAYVNRAM